MFIIAHQITQNGIYHKIIDVTNMPVYSRLKQDYINFLLNANLLMYLKLASKIWCHFVSYLQRYDTTVKPAVAATSTKRDPPLSGHFRAPRTILNANAPLLSVHLSNAASGRRQLPQNTEIVPSNSQFLSVDVASLD